MTMILKNHSIQNLEQEDEEWDCEDIDEFDSEHSSNWVQIIPEFGNRNTFRGK